MAKEPKKITLSDGQECIINSCGGRQGRRFVLQIIDLLKPEQLIDQKEVSKNVANSLMTATGSENFVNKSEKLLDDLFRLAYVKVNDNFIELSPEIFENEFSNRYGVMIELLIEIIEHNGFLDLLGYLKTASKMFQQ